MSIRYTSDNLQLTTRHMGREFSHGFVLLVAKKHEDYDTGVEQDGHGR
jgi:hypothetical protein